MIAAGMADRQEPHMRLRPIPSAPILGRTENARTKSVEFALTPWVVYLCMSGLNRA